SFFAVHIFYCVEMFHVDRVLKGKSDNTWKTSNRQRNKWDYGWTYGTTIIFGVGITLTMWVVNWDSHQKEYTAFGIVNSNLGMMGCACLAYLLCCTYSFWKGMEIVLDEDRRLLEFTRRDNKYETSKDPKNVENEEKCWRNILPIMLGAPIQFFYSVSLLANLAFDWREIKYANIFLVSLNLFVTFSQAIFCDRKFLGRWRGRQLASQPLLEQFNHLTWLTTSETIAKKG
ncbi:hypothetical protein PMAYCL1PPCAC_30814, partial [Pristionchus mayeri]